MMTSNHGQIEIPSDALSVYDGRHHLGWTCRRGKEFEAVRPDRTTTGLFGTLQQARNSLRCGEG
jgi:hypothetical protein